MFHRLALLGLVGCVLMSGLLAPAHAAQTRTAAAVELPVLKWQYGGCAAPPHYCDTGWYASPAVADLDNDGKPEVIWGNYELFALNGEDGSTQWSAKNGARIWPAIAVADIDGNGSLEVVVGRGGDQVTAYAATGAALWTRNPFGGGEVRTLALSDLEGDGRYEVVVGRASGGDTKQVSVYEPDGSLRPGWPARHDNEAGYGWGMYNENIAIADMNGDGKQEIFAPTDTHYITGLAPDGSQLPVNPIYGAGKVWSQVGVHVDHAVDLRGYANCGTEHRPNFANVAPVIADMDGDGTLELVVPGDVYNCAIGDPAGDMYYLPWIFKVDRTRWSGSGFDWTVLPTPVPNSGALSQDYSVIENAVMNAVAADLDGDGTREILYPAYDGRLHAFWLDKTEHGAWPFKVPGSGIRFASEPVVADLNNDGQAEVIFTSWPEVASGKVGQVIILNSQGQQIYAIDLPTPGSGGTWNGGLGAPTIANIDADPDLELVIGTSHSGAVAYDLPGSANARVLWGTGRGSQLRSGLAPPALPTLTISSAVPAQAIAAGGSASYVISLGGINAPISLSAGAISGPAPLPTLSLTPDSLSGPGQVTLSLTDQHTAGSLIPGAAYQVTLTATSGSNTRTLTVHMIVGGVSTYLPLVRR